MTTLSPRVDNQEKQNLLVMLIILPINPLNQLNIQLIKTYMLTYFDLDLDPETSSFEYIHSFFDEDFDFEAPRPQK